MSATRSGPGAAVKEERCGAVSTDCSPSDSRVCQVTRPETCDRRAASRRMHAGDYPGGRPKALRADMTGLREAGRQGGMVGMNATVVWCGHGTGGMWANPAVRPETKGTLGRALNAVSRAVALTH